ncbi:MULTISPECIES: SMI1/KNR4 family protein [unclassified Streptomyces]|uniref:SMI1/KNR4 family protein n=1 Tax=unclassified Streptomyces TaxID=2593676 RepID=UPI002FC362D5
MPVPVRDAGPAGGRGVCGSCESGPQPRRRRETAGHGRRRRPSHGRTCRPARAVGLDRGPYRGAGGRWRDGDDRWLYRCRRVLGVRGLRRAARPAAGARGEAGRRSWLDPELAATRFRAYRERRAAILGHPEELPPPVTEAALDEAERSLGRSLPADLRALYLIADGDGFRPAGWRRRHLRRRSRPGGPAWRGRRRRTPRRRHAVSVNAA